ncbi:MAG TPA: molybdopterin biosynthesis protein [Eubacteriaceae bacterium]|nr:molybdopterin biosynthesis protein [Eubacteriaceae bacterium]
MKYKYLENKELSEAIDEYIEQLEREPFSLKTETVPVTESLHRVTSEKVLAKINAPHYYACAMDGIAVRAGDTFGATDTTPTTLMNGKDFVVVDTGDPLPQGFDAVIMIEDVMEDGEDLVKIYKGAAPWQHIRQIGEDVCKEEMILPANTHIEPAAIGAMLAGGVGKVKVYKRPKIGIIPTGDEIVAPKEDPKPGEIIEFNSSIFRGIFDSWNMDVEVSPIIEDKLEKIKDAVEKMAESCDMVLLNAGSSAGRDDYANRAIAETGKVLTHGLAIKPGKPTILGIVNKKPAIGIPGYPVSGMIVIQTVVKAIAEWLMKSKTEKGEWIEASLGRRIMSTLKYEEFVRMKVGYVDEKFVATPLDRGAGVVTSFVKADGLMRIPMNREGMEAGEKVSVELLKEKAELKQTLTITGSHDPLLDVVYDLTNQRDHRSHISSSHVGSQGGIMAIKRKEAHLAGIHLLDEATGEYNTAFIKKYLKTREIALIKGVKRIQGLMVKKGNPKEILSIEDLTREEVSFVNRQKGSGTRILLDYLMKEKGIKKEEVYGYDREEFTHMSVAVQIASGSADVGLGIYSAAKIYDLEFIPVWEEEYDFITDQAFLTDPKVEKFLELIQSKEFAEELEAMGGYRLEDIGKVMEISR